MKMRCVLVLFLLVGCSKAVDVPKCPECVCPAPVECPTCEVCKVCEVCVPPLDYDAVASWTFWIVDTRRNKKSAYMATTARHVGDRWVFDMIDSTGGPKTEAEMRDIGNPNVLLDKVLHVARNNHGSGTARFEEEPIDFGHRSAFGNSYVRGDEAGVIFVFSVSVHLIP